MSKIRRITTMVLASFMVVGLLAGAGAPSSAYYTKKCPRCGTTATSSTDASGHITYHCANCRYSFI